MHTQTHDQTQVPVNIHIAGLNLIGTSDWLPEIAKWTKQQKNNFCW